MIVADTNLIAYFLINSGFTPDATAVYRKDPEWIAPVLWRSELRNALIQSLRHSLLGLDDILIVMDRAEGLMKDKSYHMDSSRILRLAADSGCSAYDCEFVALAQDMGIPMLTSDRALIAKFKPTVVSMKTFCS